MLWTGAVGLAAELGPLDHESGEVDFYDDIDIQLHLGLISMNFSRYRYISIERDSINHHPD